MPWFWQTSSSDSSSSDDAHPSAVSAAATAPPSDLIHSFENVYTWISAAGLTALVFGATQVYRTRLRRIPNVDHLPPSTLHASLVTHPRSLFGRVVTIADGDGLRFYHTPGGLFAFWGWLRTVPTAPFPRNDRKKPGASFLASHTLSVRLSGIDAPEAAHFGKPAQPFADEAMDYLKRSLLGRNVRLYPHSKDQYGRVVGTVLARPLGGLGVGWPKTWQRDVGLEMVHVGLATVYEARYGSEFGGPAREKLLRRAEKQAQSKKQGMWAMQRKSGGGTSSSSSSSSSAGARDRWRPWSWITSLFSATPAKEETLETPREFKRRARAEQEKHG